MKSLAPNYTQRLANLLHILSCKQPHLEKMELLYQDTGMCHYFLEHSVENCWELPSHQLWLEEAEDFVGEIGAPNTETAFKLLSRLLQKRQELELLFEEYPALRRWFLILLEPS